MSIPLAGGQHSHGFLVKLVSPLTNPPKFTFIINPSGLDPRENDENPEGIAAEFRRGIPPGAPVAKYQALFEMGAEPFVKLMV